MRESRSRHLALVLAMGAVWVLLIARAGVWRATTTPAEGVLSRTFQGWTEVPATKHLYQAQYTGNEFATGSIYPSYTYPFLFANAAVVLPTHWLAGTPLTVAHNAMPYVYVVVLLLLLAIRTAPTTRWPVVFLAVGVLATTPLLWVSLLNYNRDNFHVLAAGVFCFLSTYVFTGELPLRVWTIAGVFLALWSPIYIPAWLLAGLYSRRPFVITRRWFITAAAVAAIGIAMILLPRAVAKLFGIVAHGNGFRFRSGLDGSTQYMTSMAQAMLWPIDPRHWPTGTYLSGAIVGAALMHQRWRAHPEQRPIDQTLFLALPYATVAILLPQFTSIHPYFTDILIAQPATFLAAFWTLQPGFFEGLSGRGLVIWLVAVAGVLMTNVLTIVQAFSSR